MASTKKKGKGSGPFESLRALRDELSQKAADKGKPAVAPRPSAPEPRRPARAEPSSTAGREAEDEALLFHRLFAGVEPLDRSRGGRVPRQPVERSGAAEQAARKGRDRASAEDATVHERLRTLVEGGERFEVADDGRHVEGRRADVPTETVRRLRRGLLPIDSRLDLHGMRAEEARTALESFLGTMRGRGERCVLVIHGKGEHSPLGVGVLRGEMAAWLAQGGASRHVAAFATALDRDGGEGAIYVMLRR